MKSKVRTSIFKLLFGIGVIWAILTVWMQFSGKEKVEIVQAERELKRALIVYNPDPIYNLDAKVCRSFAKGLLNHQISSTIASVKSVDELEGQFDLYVFCVNTYNWAPDWRLTNYIKEHARLKNKKVCAITVGAGSTMRAQRKLEWHLQDKGVELLGSEMFWLLRPNDENRMQEKNVLVANDQAKSFGDRIGQLLKDDN